MNMKNKGTLTHEDIHVKLSEMVTFVWKQGQFCSVNILCWASTGSVVASTGPVQAQHQMLAGTGGQIYDFSWMGIYSQIGKLGSHPNNSVKPIAGLYWGSISPSLDQCEMLQVHEFELISQS